MKKRWNLGIDIDGTITDPATFIPHLNQAFQKQLLYEEITQYHLPPLFGVSDHEFMEWFTKNEGNIYSNAQLADAAKEILDELGEAHQLIYISARNQVHHQLTLDWFNQQKLPYHHITLLGSHDKINMARNHAIEIFFEDKLENANDLSEELDIPVMLFNTPYNQGSIHQHVKRVQHWREARHVFNSFIE
jgi:uncharacterized HAD superfamily protein